MFPSNSPDRYHLTKNYATETILTSDTIKWKPGLRVKVKIMNNLSIMKYTSDSLKNICVDVRCVINLVVSNGSKVKRFVCTIPADDFSVSSEKMK